MKQSRFFFEKKWEAYLKYPSHTLFLDIETEGLSKEKNEITIIGVFKKGCYYPFINGFNLEKVLNFLIYTPIWVTFGGENFDLPFIKQKFPFLQTPYVHLDLYHLSKEVGLKGGLKKVEKLLGIKRVTEGLNGYDAVKLWNKWQKEKDKEALRKLILYNKEDVINLKKILDLLILKIKDGGRI